MADARVLVTGGTGFIAAEIIRQLLAKGYTVRATVRDVARTETAGHLTALPGAEDRLELVPADLLDADSFSGAADDCEFVLHVASPYITSYTDPQTELVDPALHGTRAVLAAVEASPSVRKVVLTSSIAAIFDSPPARPLTEDDWNVGSSLDRNAYSYSKTVAERAAWEWAETSGIPLVVINPGAVFGPSLVPSLNTTNGVLASFFDGTLPAIMDLHFAGVDVRDVAAAHIAAMENPAANGRYICTSETTSMRDAVELLRGVSGSKKLPSLGLDNAIGNQLAKVLALFQPRASRHYIWSNIGRPPRMDNSKLRSELGIEPRPIGPVITESYHDMVEWGHIVE